MKELWVEAEDGKKESLQSLITQYSDVLVEGDKATFLASKQTLRVVPASVANLEKINTRKAILRICIQDKETENLIVKAAELGASYLIISCANWRVIPLENLIARIKGKSKLIAEVTNAEEAKVAIDTLELGTDGILLKTSDKEELKKNHRYRQARCTEP